MSVNYKSFAVHLLQQRFKKIYKSSGFLESNKKNLNISKKNLEYITKLFVQIIGGCEYRILFVVTILFIDVDN